MNSKSNSSSKSGSINSGLSAMSGTLASRVSAEQPVLRHNCHSSDSKQDRAEESDVDASALFGSQTSLPPSSTTFTSSSSSATSYEISHLLYFQELSLVVDFDSTDASDSDDCPSKSNGDGIPLILDKMQKRILGRKRNRGCRRLKPRSVHVRDDGED